MTVTPLLANHLAGSVCATGSAHAANSARGTAQAADTVKLDTRITAATGGSFYLDKGRSSGLEVGDRIVLYPSSGPTCEGTVRAVSKNTARVELDPGANTPAVGDRGEISVPRSRLGGDAPKPAPVPEAAPVAPVATTPTVTPSTSAPANTNSLPTLDTTHSGQTATTDTNAHAATTPAQQPTTPAQQPTKPAQGTAPDHPAWAHPEENWAPNQPLLAPAFGLAPEERERRIHGRAYMQAQGTWDNQGGTRKYYLGSLGADATMENPFGQGGSFRIDASVWTRTADADAIDVKSEDTRLRLSRFTYEFGGTEDRPTRWQFGRFLQHEFPEFGLLDGVEWDRRLGANDVVGATVGAMPEPFSDMKSFQDTQAAIYYRHAFDEKRKNRIGFGYQNTWHKGKQDRNLFLADADLRPTKDLTLNTTAWIDHYGSEDTVKSQGFELTEFLVSANWNTTTTTGLGVTYSHRRIPELLRNEFVRYDATQLDRNKLNRVALYGWWAVSNALRIDGRFDRWSDQDDSGVNGELGAALRNVVWDEGELRASVFYADGSYSSGPGIRAQASKSFGAAYGSLGYEFVDYEQKDFSGEQRKLGQHAVFGTLDVPVFGDWDLSLMGEKRFGDEQDSYTLSLLLQTHF